MLRRILLLQSFLKDSGLTGAVLFYSRDVFYYTNTAQPSYLIVRPDDYMLFVRRGFDTALRESWLEAGRISSGKNPEAAVQSFFPGPALPGEKVGTELEMLTIPHARTLNRSLNGRKLVDVSLYVLKQRMVKDEKEIENIRKSCRAVHSGHLAAMSCLREGVSELDLSAAVENAHRVGGHEGCFFMRTTDFVMSRGPLASGPNMRRTSGTLFTLSGAGLSNAVPTGASRRIIRRGDFVLIDIPTCVEGYHADQSRTYFVGKAPAKALDLFSRLREIADSALAVMNPGVSCRQLYSHAFSKAESLGLGESFMCFEGGVKAHFIGHGLGLEINEPPLISAAGKVVLVPGMTLALELHLMTPDGYTMKLEDTVLITEAGAEILTLSPRELIEV